MDISAKKFFNVEHQSVINYEEAELVFPLKVLEIVYYLTLLRIFLNIALENASILNKLLSSSINFVVFRHKEIPLNTIKASSKF